MQHIKKISKVAEYNNENISLLNIYVHNLLK